MDIWRVGVGYSRTRWIRGSRPMSQAHFGLRLAGRRGGARRPSTSASPRVGERRNPADNAPFHFGKPHSAIRTDRESADLPADYRGYGKLGDRTPRRDARKFA